ncbi:MAG: tripartite tricarboxylate transporter TctB family protein [Mesorhizobium sp.]
MDKSRIDIPNIACGAIFIVFGALFAWQSLQHDLGTTLRMGPGYFPLVVAVILIILGAIIMFQALRTTGEPVGEFAWRGMFFILFSPIFFALTVRGLGFIGAIFLTSLLASFASIRMTVPKALILGVCVTAFTTIVFVLGLGLPFRLVGPWLGQ